MFKEVFEAEGIKVICKKNCHFEEVWKRILYMFVYLWKGESIPEFCR